MATLTEIERKTKEFADKREALKVRIAEYELGIQAVKRKYLSGIKAAAGRCMEKQAELKSMIEESPELFVKPKTWTMHNVRLGFKKEKGKLTWEDDSKVIKLIKKNYPVDWEIYVKVVEKPLATALGQLPGAELKKLGVTVTEDSDEVYIKSMDSEIDKLVNALLKEDDMPEMKEAV